MRKILLGFMLLKSGGGKKKWGWGGKENEESLPVKMLADLFIFIFPKIYLFE